ncbi:hypothetical protein SK128_019070, partial [Halocaridina rubra]
IASCLTLAQACMSGLDVDPARMKRSRAWKWELPMSNKMVTLTGWEFNVLLKGQSQLYLSLTSKHGRSQLIKLALDVYLLKGRCQQ